MLPRNNEVQYRNRTSGIEGGFMNRFDEWLFVSLFLLVGVTLGYSLIWFVRLAQ